MLFPKTSFPPPLSAAARLQTREQIVQQFSCADRLTLPFPHSFPRGTEVTENPLSKCVPLCRPTWVQGVISRKGASTEAIVDHIFLNQSVFIGNSDLLNGCFTP